MRFAPIVAGLLLLSGCGSEPQQMQGAMEAVSLETAVPPPGLTGSGSEPPALGQPRIAYRYGLFYRLPADAIAPAQAAHIALCDSLGPTRCRLLAQQRTVNEGDFVSGSLRLEVAASEARAFADRMDAAVAEKDGAVAGRSVEAEDLAKQMIDAEARIAAKEALAGRLMQLLERRDGKVADLVEAERAFAQTQEELDAARKTLAEFSRRVAMSTISADYQSRAPAGNAAGRPIADAIASAGQTLGRSVGAVIVFAVAALPWAALILALLWAVRRWRRRRALTPETPASTR